MASQGRGRDHLDATVDREVVYCHASGHQWYRDEEGLDCPYCGSDATEIVDPEHDPREPSYPDHPSVSTSPGLHPLRYDNNSDPDEADIDDHMADDGFIHHRNIRAGPGQVHHNPEVDPVLERFLDMLSGFGAPGRARESIPLAPGSPSRDASGAPTETQRRFREPRVHHTTFTSGTFGGGTASVTIFSGPAPGHARAQLPGGGQGDPFQAIFSNVIRDMGPPEGGDQQGGAPPGFARSLQDILSLFNPANAVAGDAVYSQEALDRIISNLMEANPQSNAAPPASDHALQNLDRRPVHRSMLEGDSKTDCSICIEHFEENEMAVFLPCKHWYHEACVVEWLKAHNTCPICRTPIEKNTGNGANISNNTDTHGSRPANHEGVFSSVLHGASPSSRPYPGLFRAGSGSESQEAGTSGIPPSPDQGGGVAAGTFSASPPLHSRPSHQSGSPLGEALRNISSQQRERQRERDRNGRSGYGSSYDTSRLQRRTSISPTSPRAAGPAEHGARMRQRSPSESSRRDRTDDDSRRQSGSGPLSWLRDRFSGSGGSGQGSSRSERRY